METLRHDVVRIHTRGAYAIVDACSIAQNRWSRLCAPSNQARANMMRGAGQHSALAPEAHSKS